MYFIGTGHTEYLQAKWAKLIQARIRVENARRRFSDASTLHSTVTPLADIPGWKDATIESFRLQFRLIDLNRDGLIDYKEMYESMPYTKMMHAYYTIMHACLFSECILHMQGVLH